jgi:hypothetical protein
MRSITLSRYFAVRFFVAVAAVFVGIFVLVGLIDYIDLVRKAGDVTNAPAAMLALISLYRVPQIMERLLPFSVLTGAMTRSRNMATKSCKRAAQVRLMLAIVAATILTPNRSAIASARRTSGSN